MSCCGPNASSVKSIALLACCGSRACHLTKPSARCSSSRPAACWARVLQVAPDYARSQKVTTAQLRSCDSCGVAVGRPTPHAAVPILLVSIVAAPLRASARPETLAPVVDEMLVSARMFPTKVAVFS